MSSHFEPFIGESKPWYTSATVWFNVLSLVVGVALNYGFKDYTPASWVNEAQLVATTVINWALRVYKTKQPIGSE